MNEKQTGNQQSKTLWLYRSEVGRWLMALIVSGLTLVVVFCIAHPVFMTIDDGRLKYVFAGYSSGTPVESYLFSYYPLSFVLSKLYTLFPNFHWYALYQFGVIGLSCTLIGKTIYKIAYRRGFSCAKAVLIHLWVYLSTALISTILMHFEITATMAGTAGVVLLLGCDMKKDKTAWKIMDFIFSILGIAASFVIQYNAFYAACCYLLVALVFLLLNGIKQKNVKQVIKLLICYLLCFATVIAGIKILENQSKDTPEWEEYLAYNKYRVSFWDYPHISYEDNPELFEEMGWSEEFYDLTQSMYFMDERFNEENLSKFTEYFSWFNFSSIEEMKNTLIDTLSELFRNERLATLQTGIIAAMLLAIIALLCLKHWRGDYYPQILSAICCIGGTIFVLLFLGAKGRLPLRAWLACTIPCISVVSILLLMLAGTQKKKKIQLTMGILVCIWVLGLSWTYNKIINVDREWRVSRSEGAIHVEQYACEHPDKVYVYDLMGAQNYSVFSIYPQEDFRPTNAFVWGSSYLFTPVYQDQLAINNIDSLTTEDLFRDNVYFIAHGSGVYVDLLYEMLCAEYGQVEMNPVDKIENSFVVYKINKVQG